MSKQKFSPWSYVLLVNESVVGAFVSASLAYGHWLAYAEKYSNPDDPFVHCIRFRYSMEPYQQQQQDVTMLFMKQWQLIRESKNQTEK